LVLDEPKVDRDKVFGYDTLKMVIDGELLTRLGEVMVDYRDSAWKSGFSVTAAKDFRGGAAAAGCGSSCC
jgi:Fe-S cluster assembly iron-binding protein IscA